MPFQIGNPGRPQGAKNKAPSQFAKYIREQTDEGRRLVDFALAVFDNDSARLEKVTLPDRMDAMKYLTDRGWGKAKEIIEFEGDLPVKVDLSALSTDELKLAKALMAKVKAKQK